MKALITRLSYLSSLLIITLFFFPLFCDAQKRTIPPLDIIYTSNVPKSINLIDCNPSILNNNLVFNPAFNTNATYDPTHWDNPFAYGHIDFWSNAFSTPNFDFTPGAPPPYPGIHAAFMGSTNSGNQIFSEGLIGKLSPLIPGNEYSLSFYLNTLTSIPDNLSHAYNIYLMHCNDVPTYFPNPNTQFVLPNLPPNSQRIFCETNSGFTNWHQVSTCFTPNQDYDMILIFPAITPIPTTPYYNFYIGFAYPEIIAKSTFNIVVSTPNPANPCIRTLSPSYAVNNATYQWYLNGNLFSTFPNPQISTSTQFGHITLQVTLPNGGTNSTCSASCDLSANVDIPQCVSCAQPIVTPSGPIDYYYMWEEGPVIGVKLNSNSLTGNQWYKNGIILPNETQPVITVREPGNYTVSVNGCYSNNVILNTHPYGTPSLPFSEHIMPVQSPGYYCVNSTDIIKLFDLGGSANYTWNTNPFSSPVPAIQIDPLSYNIHSPYANVIIGNSVNTNDHFVQGVADLNGAQKILDYAILLTQVVNWQTLQYCRNTTYNFYATWNTSPWTLPGGTKFDYESYDFGANGVIVAPPAYAGLHQVTIPTNTPLSVPLQVQFSNDSYMQYHFYYNWGGCYKMYRPIQIICGRESSDNISNISIYPNPSASIITITSTNGIDLIEISDLMVPSLKTVKTNGLKSVTINIIDLKPGVYNCKITSGKGAENRKIVIKR